MSYDDEAGVNNQRYNRSGARNAITTFDPRLYLWTRETQKVHVY